MQKKAGGDFHAMDTPTNKSTSYEEMIRQYEKYLKRGYYLFPDDGSGDECDHETGDDDDYCNEANCC